MPTCEIGILVALSIEAGGLLDRMSQVISQRGKKFQAATGILADRNIVVAQSGPGCDNAARGADALIRGHAPDWIISAGFAGGLQPELQRNDIVLANEVIDTEGNRFQIDAKFNLPSFSDAKHLHQGKLLTVSKVITKPTEKIELGKKYTAVAVDMETLAVAQKCVLHKTPLISTRVISDAADDHLPDDIQRLLQQASTMSRLGAATRALFRRPSSLKDMWSLKETALIASEKLAIFIEELLESLPQVKNQPNDQPEKLADENDQPSSS